MYIIIGVRFISRYGVKVIAFLLAYLLSVQSVVAAVQTAQMQSGALPVGAAGAVGSALLGSQLTSGPIALSTLVLQPLSGPSLSAAPSVKDASLSAAPVAVQDASVPSASDRAAVSGYMSAAASSPRYGAVRTSLSDAVRVITKERIQSAALAAVDVVRG